MNVYGVQLQICCVQINNDIAANDNFNALLDLFKKFPSYKGRDFYISGNLMLEHMSQCKHIRYLCIIKLLLGVKKLIKNDIQLEMENKMELYKYWVMEINQTK